MYLEVGSQRPSPEGSRRRLFSSHCTRRGSSFRGSLGDTGTWEGQRDTGGQQDTGVGGDMGRKREIWGEVGRGAHRS